MRIRAIVQIGFVLLLSVAVQAEEDVRGGEDPQQLPRFPLSWIVSYSEEKVPEYALATGPMKKLEGVISPEKIEISKGLLTRVTYRVPDAHTPKKIFAYYLKNLQSINAEILFQCSSRQCGSSNQWANNYFEVAELYGIDRTQYYLSATTGNMQLALYTVKRGNRRVYIHLDILKPAEQTEESLAADLQQQGFSWLDDSENINPITNYLVRNPQQKILIGSYARTAGEGVSELLSRSNDAANKLAEQLIAAGVETQRIETVGVGPAVPIAGRGKDSGVWVQLR
ncbi:DUF4892 domain-containing protein [Amphritea japonica]|uniref:DUF4892 domain-containing protein n=1 Tax=Amphritea japonica ATCC BAA-1530 TaxID=1278309 RepID=A0A7R6P5N1_9GAMM|nr:DUF4892 domain-containing protein [Amphritea japonica]BBB26409.1 conserved hypothetical protein [Amphritea japonica ATCC BAA-1530]